jgi:hypothetical protein
MTNLTEAVEVIFANIIATFRARLAHVVAPLPAQRRMSSH